MKEEKHQKQFIVICFVISLLPLLALSFYNHPAMDDYNYGILTHRALVENQGLAVIPAVLGAAVQRAVNLWHSWQGTYTFSILAALRPSILTERLTFLHTFILLGVFAVGFLYLSKVLLHRIWGSQKCGSDYSLRCDDALHSVCTVWSRGVLLVEWKCWLYRTFFRDAPFWGLLADSLFKEKVTAKRMTALILLAVLLAGGMYPTALLTGVVLFFVALDVLAGKKYGENDKDTVFTFVCTLSPAFGLSFIAPGNARRQAFFQHRTPFEAIYKSYTKSLDYMFTEATNGVIVLVVFALFIYMLWKLKDTKFSFRCPLMFTLVSYSMLVVMWVPGIYAVRYISGGRYFNILYYGVILFMLPMQSIMQVGYAASMKNVLRRQESLFRAVYHVFWELPVFFV